MTIPYLLVDGDNHLYEPRDLYLRYCPSAESHHALQVRVDADGEEAFWAGDRRYHYGDPSHVFEKVGIPGSLKALLKGMKTGSIDEKYLYEAPRPEYLEVEPRLRALDEQGVEKAVLFAGSALHVEAAFGHDPAHMYMNLDAYNTWLYEHWGYARDGRIYATPMLSLLDLDSAVRQIETVIERGARVICLRPGPVDGRGPSDPYFDPFWSRANEAGITAAFHLTDAGYNASISTMWGYDADVSARFQSAWQWLNCQGDRPLMDTFSAMIYDNFFAAFPNVRLASVENGAEWLSYFVPTMDKMRGMGRRGLWRRGQLSERPSEIFAKHVFVTPYPEDNLVELVERIGARSLVMGSDWPHPEGTVTPGDFKELVKGLSEKDQRLILRDNGLRMVGAA